MKLKGIVVKGKGRGAKLGFPTINVSWAIPGIAQLTLKSRTPLTGQAQEGVWAALVKVSGKKMAAVAFLGAAKTFGEKEKKLEVHIFDFGKKLYGKKVEVDFLKRIRGNKKFSTKKALISQMKKDEARAREFFKNNVYRDYKKHRRS